MTGTGTSPPEVDDVWMGTTEFSCPGELRLVVLTGFSGTEDSTAFPKADDKDLVNAASTALVVTTVLVVPLPTEAGGAVPDLIGMEPVADVDGELSLGGIGAIEPFELLSTAPEVVTVVVIICEE
jgi:hypothetical protein